MRIQRSKIIVRGCQKKVIFLKNTGSHLFDEAYFIVSRACEDARIVEGDMVCEANRIIDESLGIYGSGRKRGGAGRMLSFLFPFLLGVLISAMGFIAYNSLI